VQLRAGMANDAVLLPAADGLHLIVGFAGEGIFSNVKTAAGWGSWTQATDASLPAAYGDIGLGQCAGTPTTICCLVTQADYAGFAGTFVSNDGGQSWNPLEVRLNTNYESQETTSPSYGYSLDLTVPTADMIAPPATVVLTTSAGGTPPHSHTVTLTPDLVAQIASGAQTVVSSDPDASSEIHTFIIYGISQAAYNHYVAVQPGDPTQVILGGSFIYTNNGGGPVFNDIAINQIHIDQHGFAFDPAGPAQNFWVGNDGGIFHTSDGGTSWTSLNNGIATLEYYDASVHPQWANVMLAGCQDNGAHRYTGNEVWLQVFGWDIGVARIDPLETTTMYIQRQDENGVMLSTQAGQPGSWNNTTGSPGGSGQWINVFAFGIEAVSGHSVFFYGNTQLWRSEDRGDSWIPVTGDLGANILAMAPHPTDPNTVFFSLPDSSPTPAALYQVQRVGPTWTGSDVTVTNIGGPAVGGTTFEAVSLAVESGGAVWAAVAGTFSGTGNPHVFRYDGSAWTAMSTGLPASVGLNTIVIDPTDESRLFCGGVPGIFRTDDGGMSWSNWDAGIPNAIINRLIIGPGRLIRACTFGRSIWERVIDPPAPCPSVDLYVRDCYLDSGRDTPSPDYVPDPLTPGQDCYHWQSPDLKVDSPEGTPPAFQTASPVSDAVGYASIVHCNPLRGATVRVYAQIHNRGYNAASNVQARVLFGDASAGLQPLPVAFWSPGPFLASPSDANWTAIDPVGPAVSIPPAQPAVLEWDFVVPATAADHSCLLLAVTCDEDAIDLTPWPSTDAAVLNNNHIALKNLHIVSTPDPPPSGLGGTLLLIELSNHGASLHSLTVNWGTLDDGARLYLAFERPSDAARHPVVVSDEVLARAGIRVAPAQPGMFPKSVLGKTGRERFLLLDRVLEIGHPKSGSAAIPDILIPKSGISKHGSLGVWIRLVGAGGKPVRATARAQIFDVVQRAGRRIVGGSSYKIRCTEPVIEE
jgi:hypothetical protein